MEEKNRTMRSGFRLGRLFGIEVRIDYSLLVIFALVAVSLGTGVLPSWHPEWTMVTVWAVALVAAVLFFLSVFVHEMSHALVARAFKLRVRSIRLFIFGGMADIEHEPDSPKAEALIAGVGPVTSIVLGVAFATLGASLAPAATYAEDPLEMARAMGPVATTLAWLGPINILLGVFNLLPGFPMDGGRVLRAGLWFVTGDFVRATRWASYTGQAIASLLMAAGIMMAFGFQVPFFGTGLVGGLWLALIGWFLSTAAGAHRGQLELQGALEGTPVRRVMRRDLPDAVPAAEPVERFIEERVLGSSETAFIVTDEGRVLGIVSPEDIRKVPKSERSDTPVSEITTHRRELQTISPDEDAFQALKRLRRSRGEVILVMDGETLVGVLRMAEIRRFFEIQSGGEGSRPDAGARPDDGHASPTGARPAAGSRP